MRPWLVLTHAGAKFVTETATPELRRQSLATDDDAALAKLADREVQARRKLGSVTGLFPVLHVDGAAIHESLAICEWANDTFPQARLWPESAIARAQARAVSCEMLASFSNVRMHMSCHLFGRVPVFSPNPATQRDIDRVFEIWRAALDRSGGPFLFGEFCIADAMYFPARTRLRTYGVPIPADLANYVAALDALPAVHALHEQARTSPEIPTYDEYLRSLGGDPVAALA